MSITRVATERHVEIAHPSEIDWFLGSAATADEERIEAIQAGLGYKPEEMDFVVNALNVTAARTGVYRQMHEKLNVQKLGLSQAEHEEYRGHAQYHESKAGFVSWFAGRAGAYFAELAPEAVPDKVALELCGVRQRGYWETGGLDQLFRALEADLAVVEPDMPMWVFEEADLIENPIKYKQIPMLSAYGGPTRIDFVTVRRRRPIANAGRLKISKEATALVLVNELPRDERLVIRGRALEDTDKSNTEAALVAGSIFARAINRYHNGSEDFTVLPTSAHYVATAEPPTYL
ncbi:MAG: hypothetical protein ACREGB_04655 [Candidatus Saccharimonadales bacterium]